MNADLKNIPKVFLVALLLLVVFFISLFTVFMPTFEKMPEYNATHDDIQASVACYEDVLKNQKTIEQRIKNMEEQYANNQSIYVDVNSSIKDLQDVFTGQHVKFNSFNRSDGMQDPLNRMSQTGFAMYLTNISFTYDGTMSTAKKIIKYMEQESNGCYFIDSLTMTPLENQKDTFSTTFNVTLYYFNTATKITTVEETSSTE